MFDPEPIRRFNAKALSTEVQVYMISYHNLKKLIHEYERLKDFFKALVTNHLRQRENQEILLKENPLDKLLDDFMNDGEDIEEVRIPKNRKDLYMSVAQNLDGVWGQNMDDIKDRVRDNRISAQEEIAIENINLGGPANNHEKKKQRPSLGQNPQNHGTKTRQFRSKLEHMHVQRMMNLKGESDKRLANFERKRHVRIVSKDYNNFQILDDQDTDLRNFIINKNPHLDLEYADFKKDGKWYERSANKDFNCYTRAKSRAKGSIAINFRDKTTYTQTEANLINNTMITGTNFCNTSNNFFNPLRTKTKTQ